MRKITCFCEHVFEVDAPELLDLDTEVKAENEIFEGSFMAYTCPNCGKLVKPELSCRIVSKKKGIDLFMFPETERLDFYHEREHEPKGSSVVIGYSELVERLHVLNAKLVPEAVEVLKYFLYQKAESVNPEADISVFFEKVDADSLEFHILGIKADQIAVMKVPLNFYEEAIKDCKERKDEEPFASIIKGSYISVMNMFKD